ncbi:Fad1p [Malassezia vespertilionis]|uniref:FAD synthase n=1 Tax=Malassezia vespertilionis TaxID=2020962 RepID=A0A2N1JCK7_9BASI|nr:Fad1p [Malassezia vespertilionis]
MPEFVSERALAWARCIDATYTIFEDPSAQKRDEHCALSFNGGKDCTVIAHVLAAVLRRRAGYSEFGGVRAPNLSDAAYAHVPQLRTLYVSCDTPFPEVEKFIAYAKDAENGYNLSLYRAMAPMRAALQQYLYGSDDKAPGHGVKAIFLGVRHDDPYGSIVHVQCPTDNGWPSVMRVHPILTWSYNDVWQFLRCPTLTNGPPYEPECASVGGGDVRCVPYCSLYDQGYTSLGSTFNTEKNPRLLDAATHTYLPAYKLLDCAWERAGRAK